VLSADGAQRKEYLKYAATVDVPSVSARIRLFKGMTAVPSPSPDAMTLTRRSGASVSKIQAYRAGDLWRREQLAARWKNDLCTLSVYSLSLPPPDGIQSVFTMKDGSKLVLSDVFEKWKSANFAADRDWGDNEIAAWLECLTGKTFSAPPVQVKRGGPRGAQTKEFISSDSNMAERFFIVFGPYSKKKPVLLHYRLNEPNEKNMKVIFSSLGSMSFYKPKKTVTSATRRVLNKNAAEDISEIGDAGTAKARVLNSIRNLKDWWYFESKNFLIVSNVRNKKTARDIALNLERSRGVYEKFYPLAEPMKDVSVARVFETRQEYANFVGKEYEWTGGLWMPSKKELVVSPMDWGNVSERRKMMIEVTQHEAFHQYIFFALHGRPTAAWFNEGNAQFFEEMTFRGQKFYVGINERKARMMPSLANLEAVKRILNISYAGFYDERTRAANYALAWGLVFFMQKGAAQLRNRNSYREILQRYYDAAGKMSADKATEYAWKGVDMDEFVQDFSKFWNSSSLIRRASR
jgi:hypothetical protein